MNSLRGFRPPANAMSSVLSCQPHSPPRIEGERYLLRIARRNGLCVISERRAPAAAVVSGDGYGLRCPVFDPEPEHGHLPRVHASETHGIRAARVEDRVRDGDNPAFPPGLARACLPGAACRGRHGQRQQQHPAQHRDSDKAAAGFPDAAFGGERFDDLVQHAVDEGAAAGCRVVFRNLDVLVERYFDGN